MLRALHEFGQRVPEDVSVIGFDDILQASVSYPKLTTVRQPLDQMGRVAVEMLLEKIENSDHQSRQVTLATQLIIRDSCRTLEDHGA